MKKLVKLTESDLRNIIKESVNKLLREMEGDIITCYGTIEQINGVDYPGSGNLFGNGIYLAVGYAPENNPYGKKIISVNVDVSNFYRAKDIQEALAIAKNNQEGYSGILYHSRHDGDVCVVFDKNCIIGKA